ncbi:amidohydrolase family protein [Amycolatopsis rhabdoformis]|uniref:Amidohydrolase family protein n=1 Tax=Amycolatopsis rhabdoformis TaxID=1448059 RepID=A0ABZ1IKZ3_9PSEU|nr:amidohydrolase family protein [Amycolatopsis rhabdoformis]WSE34165.1 amidohydrolase family protein [Amycolatopsis rhabdoformis]
MKKTLIKGGSLVTMDEDLGEFRGDVLIGDDRILEVAASIDPAGVDEVVDASDSVVLPGFVDCHNHLWQAPIRGLAASCWGREYFGVIHPLAGRYRPQDMHDATFGAAAELLLNGVTTVFDFCHATNSPDHARASLSALDSAGIRAVFGFCFRPRPEAGESSFDALDERVEVLRELASERTPDDRVQLGAALNNIDHVTLEEHAKEVRAARDIGLVSTLHSNLPGQVTASHELGLLGPDVLWVHAGPATDAELTLLREEGGTIVSTPQIEAGNMGIVPMIGRAVQHGVPLVFGVDATAAVNGDFLAHLRIGHTLSRLTEALAERAAGRSGVRTPTFPSVDATALLRMATLDSARALGLADRVGSLTPGKQADVLVLRTGPFGTGAGSVADHVVFQASARDIDLVLVAGVPRVRAGALTGVELPGLRTRLDAVRDWVLGRAPGSEWPELTAEDRKRYEEGQGKAVPA